MRAAIARYGSPTCRNRKACSRRSSVRRCCGRVNSWRLMVSPLCVRALSMCASVAAHARMTTQRHVAGAFVRPEIASSSARTAWSRGAPSGAKTPRRVRSRCGVHSPRNACTERRSRHRGDGRKSIPYIGPAQRCKTLSSSQRLAMPHGGGYDAGHLHGSVW